MNKITRNHNFSNRINMVRKGTKFYYVSSENSVNELRIRRNGNLDIAYASENWKAFEVAYANAI